MSDYSKITDFAAKDAMLAGNPLKEITGTAHDNELNAISVAIASKANSASPAITGTPTAVGATWSNLGTVTTADINGGTIDGTTQASGTINGPIAAGGTWTAAAAWTLPAFTLGGTITSNGKSFSGTIANLGTVTTADINGGTIDGAVIGGATPAAGNFTTLGATGNVTLGEASTDTVTVAGYMGVGGAGSTAYGLFIQSAALTGVYQNGVVSAPTATSAALGYISGVTALVSTADAVFTCPDVMSFRAGNGTKGAESTITNKYGLYILDQTIGTNNYGIASAVSSGANKWNIYASGTAANYFAGDVKVHGDGGLGYGTGSGGAVTQATSRTTGVTLNKTNGAITLVSAAGSTSWQSFTVTNSTVAATDTVIVSQKSGTDLNEIHVTAVAAGSFNISFRTTGGTTVEQPVFNFAVIKAVTS